MNNYGYCHQCGCYCDLVYFRKYCRCCKFVYQCDCGRCFERIFDYSSNCWYENECDCYENENIIKLKITCKEKNYNKSKCCNKPVMNNSNCGCR